MSGGLPEGFSNLDDLWDGPPADPADIAPDNSAEAGIGTPGHSHGDSRLYLPGWEAGWQVQLKTTWDREYCFAKNPGEEFYHLLMAGELYVQYDEEKFCLECARRRGVISEDRLHWKRPAD